MFIKSLARLKREKLYSALDKGRKRIPEEWTFPILIDAFYREEVEFIRAYKNFRFDDDDEVAIKDASISDIKGVMEEIADLENILEFIYDKLITEIELIMKIHKDKRMIKELKDLSYEQKTDSINYVIGLLQHDIDERVKEN